MFNPYTIALHVGRRVLSDLPAGAEGLQLSKKDDQLDLLAQVLAAGAEDAAEEADDNTDGVAQRPAARRVVGNLASMSGAAPTLASAVVFSKLVHKHHGNVSHCVKCTLTACPVATSIRSRVPTQMHLWSGAGGLTYMEYSTRDRPGGGRGARGTGRKQPKSALFRKAMRS